MTDHHRGINVGKIPIDGTVGAIYMIQFLVWALIGPAVGIFYALLIAGGLLCAPVVY